MTPITKGRQACVVAREQLGKVQAGLQAAYQRLSRLSNQHGSAEDVMAVRQEIASFNAPLERSTHEVAVAELRLSGLLGERDRLAGMARAIESGCGCFFPAIDPLALACERIRQELESNPTEPPQEILAGYRTLADFLKYLRGRREMLDALRKSLAELGE